MGRMTNMVDPHHHIIPKGYVESLAKKGIKKALGVQLPQWGVEKALEVMDRNDIATSIVSISAPGVYFKESDPTCDRARELARFTNESCAELIEKHPGRFGAFATLPPPDVEAALEELHYALDELTFDGLILLCNHDGSYRGESRFDPLFAELDRRNAAVFIHPASPAGFAASHLGLPESTIDVCFDTTRTALSLVGNGVARRYRNTRFILAHAGGAMRYLAGRVGFLFSLFESVGGFAGHVASGIGDAATLFPGLKDRMPDTLNILLRVRENVLPEGSDFYLRRFYHDTAPSASPHAFASLQTLVDGSKKVFGTDYIFATEAAVAPTIREVDDYEGFTDEDIARMAWGNAAALFPRRFSVK